MAIKVAQILEATTGGTRRHLVDLCTHLDRDRFEITVFCSTRRDPGFLDDIRLLRERGISITEVSMLREIQPVHDLIALQKLRRHLRQGDFDIVHTHSSKAGVLGRWAAHLAGVPTIIHTPHGFPFVMDVAPLWRALYLRIERRAARITDRIVCVCPFERELALRVGLCQENKLRVIENGISIPELPSDDLDAARLRAKCGVPGGGFLVGAAGRFVPQKGFSDLVNAFATVVGRVPGARLVLQGQGPERSALFRKIQKYGLVDSCRILDGHGDLVTVFGACDLVVLPSRWEALPYALLEAMGTGRPVVVTRAGGMPDAVTAGPAGVVVPPSDPAALGEAIAGLLENATLRAEYGRAGRALVGERFKLSTMVGAIEKLYRAPT